MPFGATLAGDVLQWKIGISFSFNLENVMIIVDGIMVIGYQEDEWDHDKAFTELLETAKNNIKLNFNKIQYKQQEVEFFGKPTWHKDANLVTQKSRL